jgi:hypothetical protein
VPPLRMSGAPCEREVRVIGCYAHTRARVYSTAGFGLRWAREFHLQIEMESGTPTLQ